LLNSKNKKTMLHLLTEKTEKGAKKAPQSADYFRHSKESDSLRRFTLAGIVKDNNLHIGHSVCSEKDSFSKKKGRIIAAGRAQKNPIMVVEIETDAVAKFREVFKAFIEPATCNADLLMKRG